MALAQIENAKITSAVSQVLGEFGSSARQALEYHIAKISGVDCICQLGLQQLEYILEQILGESASLVMNRIYAAINEPVRP